VLIGTEPDSWVDMKLSYDFDNFEFCPGPGTAFFGDEDGIVVYGEDEMGFFYLESRGGAWVAGNNISLVFRVAEDFDGNVSFEICEAYVVDDHGAGYVRTEMVLLQEAPELEYGLSQNHPNPFNPETTIEYALSASGQVSVVIYNMVGQVVRTLVDEHQQASKYEVVWDARDELGRPVSGGIYFCRLTAGEFSETRRMVFLK